jgi:hypothetical protein
MCCTKDHEEWRTLSPTRLRSPCMSPLVSRATSYLYLVMSMLMVRFTWFGIYAMQLNGQKARTNQQELESEFQNTYAQYWFDKADLAVYEQIQGFITSSELEAHDSRQPMSRLSRHL